MLQEVAETVTVKVGFGLIEHPPYSPDLAPRDYRLLQKKKIFWIIFFPIG